MYTNLMRGSGTGAVQIFAILCMKWQQAVPQV